MPRLDGPALTSALRELPDWAVEEKTLVRTYRCRDWTAAIGLVDKVAREAAHRNHHPDLSITGYQNVTFRLTTHSEGGVTERDVALAARIDELAAD